MARRPLISIIVPVYNTYPYLDQCLDSLVNQTLQEIEVICIDDGSTDGSADALDKRAAQDPRIRVTHQANAGVSAARNLGLEQARGDYVLFVDSDDYIDRHACTKLHNVARRDNADIVIFGGTTFPSVTWIDESLDTIDATCRGGIDALFRLQGAYPLMCNKLYRRRLIKRAGLRFSSELHLGEDHAFQFCAFPFAKVVSSVSDPIYHYRCGRADSAFSASREDLSRRADQYFEVVRQVLLFWKDHGLVDQAPAQLAAWATEFLLQAVSPLGFDQRCARSSHFAEIADSLLPADAIAQSPSASSRARCLFVSDTDAPRVTAIVLPHEHADRASTCVDSLLAQELPHIEVFLVAGAQAPSREDLADDRRIHHAESLGQALADARAPYALVVDEGDAFQPYALRIMADLADSAPSGPRVVTVRDRGLTLRVADLASLLHALSNDGTLREAPLARTWVTPDELPESPLALLSLEHSNKLWDIDTARMHLSQSCGPREVARALLACEAFTPDSSTFFDRAPLLQLTSEQAKALATQQVEELVQTKEELSAAQAAAIHNAALALCLGTADRIASLDVVACYLEAFATQAGSALLPDDTSWWPHGSDDLALFRSAQQGTTLTQRLASGRQASFCQTQSELVSDHQKLLNEKTWRLQLEESLSFRLGRAITSLPRQARDVAQELIQRRP